MDWRRRKRVCGGGRSEIGGGRDTRFCGKVVADMFGTVKFSHVLQEKINDDVKRI